MLDRKIGAARCQILGVKWIKFALPRPLVVFKGPILRRGRRRGRDWREGKGRKGREKKGGENDILALVLVQNLLVIT